MLNRADPLAQLVPSKVSMTPGAISIRKLPAITAVLAWGGK